MRTIPERQNTTDEGQAAVPPTAAEMGKLTVREQLEAALEVAQVLAGKVADKDPFLFAIEGAETLVASRLALARHRAEPEGHEPSCCYDETRAECPCYQEGLEAQRERVR